MINYDREAAAIYAQNKAVGWWDDPNRCIYQTLQLVSTEVAEATEGERKNLMDDHLPTRKMGEVELADALIRVLDLGGRYNWRFDDKVTPPPQCLAVDMSIGGKHLFINACLIGLLHNLQDDPTEDDSVVNYHYSHLIRSIEATAESHGYDLAGAMAEKLAYNRSRADHKRENRAKSDGKKF